MTTPTRVCCPECHGRCCRLHGHAGGGEYVTHTDDPENDYSRHVCPNCWDGSVPAGSVAAAPRAPTCATCRFYRDGRCYRYPPSPERGRPLVASDDFCGEWGSP